MPGTDTAPATEAHVTNSAHRAVDDPKQLARATRIVRAALARRKLTHDDLTPLPDRRKRHQVGQA